MRKAVAKRCGQNWAGRLTFENVETVVESLLQLLGGKKYTFVTVLDDPNKVDVLTSQELGTVNPIEAYRDKEHAGFQITDSHGVRRCSTIMHKGGDPDGNPYIIIEEKKIIITLYFGADRKQIYTDDGYRVRWIIVVE